MKNGKSEIVVSDGKIIRLTKDKNGILEKELLTKKWSIFPYDRIKTLYWVFRLFGD